jgi:hypothetical protein
MALRHTQNGCFFDILTSQVQDPSVVLPRICPVKLPPVKLPRPETTRRYRRQRGSHRQDPNLTGEIEDDMGDSGEDKAAQSLGREGGRARAAKLTPKERSAIARKAAKARWTP